MKKSAIHVNLPPKIIDIKTSETVELLEKSEIEGVAQLASSVAKTPSSIVLFAGRYYRWSAPGCKLSDAPQLSENSKIFSIFASNPELVVVADTTLDPRFFEESMEFEAAKIRFCAGIPLVDHLGNVLGTILVMDAKPQSISDEQITCLKIIAKNLMTLFEARRQLLSVQNEVVDGRLAEQSLFVFKQALDCSVAPVTICDLSQPDNPIIYLNRAFEELSGYTAYEIIGRNCRFLQGKDRRQTVIAQIRESVEKRRPFKGVVRNFRKNGTPFWNELSIIPLKDNAGEIRYLLGEQKDISHLHGEHSLRLGSEGQISPEQGKHGFTGSSLAIQELIQQIEAVAQSDSSVLIQGETGTGKELVATAIHNQSSRSKQPFIAINCAGISETLLTSQLFGHKRGSFTGAIDNTQGVFEAAHNGTIFLDEIGDMPVSLQVAILRVIQEREVTRVGETKPRKVNIRILAATHRDIAKLVAEGQFREDLLYRIRVARIQTPPLRELKDDIVLLATKFIKELNQISGKAIEGLSPSAAEALREYHWPGNVRELRSAIEYAFIQCHTNIITVSHLPPEVVVVSDSGFTTMVSEKEQIETALKKTRGRKNAAAKLLGISRATLFRRLAQYKLDKG